MQDSSSKNPIRDKVAEYKSSMNPKALFVITSDDKIIYVSSPLLKIFKQDPTGTSFFQYVHPDEMESIKATLETCESLEAKRVFQYRGQTFSLDLKTDRENINGRIIGLTVINNITIK